LSAASITSPKPGRYVVAGDLTFATVREALRQSPPTFGGETQIEFDLSGVTAADSAGLALLVEWYRRAAQSGGEAKFSGVPTQVRALAKISDLDKLLNLG